MEEIHDVTEETLNLTDATDTGDDLDLFEEEEGENVEALKERLAKTEEANKRLYARLQKEKKEPLKTNQDTTNDYLTKDEAILIAKGMDLEDLEQAKLIQKGMGGSLKDALENPLFTSYVKQKEAEAKRKEAQLGASNGSSQRATEGFNKPNMTEEEHRELWLKSQK